MVRHDYKSLAIKKSIFYGEKSKLKLESEKFRFLTLNYLRGEVEESFLQYFVGKYEYTVIEIEFGELEYTVLHTSHVSFSK